MKVAKNATIAQLPGGSARAILTAGTGPASSRVSNKAVNVTPGNVPRQPATLGPIRSPRTITIIRQAAGTAVLSQNTWAAENDRLFDRGDGDGSGMRDAWKVATINASTAMGKFPPDQWASDPTPTITAK